MKIKVRTLEKFRKIVHEFFIPRAAGAGHRRTLTRPGRSHQGAPAL